MYSNGLGAMVGETIDRMGGSVRPTRSSTHRGSAWTLLVILATAPLSSACTARRPVSMIVSRPDSVAIRGKARVTMMNGVRFHLESATLTQDSITGRQRMLSAGGTEIRRTALPLTSVERIESERVHVWKTVLLITGLTLGVLSLGASDDFAPSFDGFR